MNTLTGIVQEACPVRRPLKRESAAPASRRKTVAADTEA